ncbi:restriction endonuclease subunit S [Arthrobacter crusticola]|uniref:Restriction endonuclease subunit S n=1 Tax=Arthrobacter crusticola TaxID=2547960 RepID=A0A4R5TTD5_9MICC|nr:restriction endonuclease subunit S [Arthrobacter crusticola]TDK23506.1 restriction endonuclease subunit S [Arthrobacter crusticola]
MIADKLRKSILQDAMSGLLTNQLPSDGDARELLARIRAERAALVASGERKKDKLLPPISEEEIPFDIPANWVWVRFGDVLRFINGRAYKQDELLSDGKYKVLRVGNLFTNAHWYYSDLELEDEKYCDSGDLLYCWSASFGPHLWDAGRAIFHYHIWNVKYGPLVKKFVYYMLMRDVDSIRNSTTGSTMVHVSMTNMMPRMMPLPPLAEQERIVERLEQLLPQVNELASNEIELDALRKRFPDDMRNAILQDAVSGRLTQQLPPDGDAGELLAQIDVKKAQMVAAGQLKQEKPLPPILESEIPFQVPKSWAWARVGQICILSPRNTASDDVKVGFLPMARLQDGYGSEYEFEIRRWGEVRSGYTHFQDGDLVLAKITPCFQNRKSAVLNGLESGLGAGTTEFHVLRGIDQTIDMRYLLFFFKTADFIRDGVRAMTGTAGQQRVGASFLKDYLIPVPPLAEQKRIVERLQDLLPLCEALG